MFYSEKSTRSAFFINKSGSAERLKRVPFMSGSFNEAWLQELLAENPSLLPGSDVGAEYHPLICIGREVPVGSSDNQGYIDNLYVSSSGSIVIVETKLFRNQESRRTVVAQIIDYAKEISTWDCDKINKVAEDYYYQKEGQASRIIDVMVRNGYLSLSDEGNLNDAINRCIEKASFLLLIVGDGIRSNVRQLADFLNENTSMSFNLALAEMEVYESEEGVIVVPNLIEKTSVIERYVISGTPDKELPEDPGISKPYIRKPILSRREFVSVFSENGGLDPDVITEFLCDIEAIPGISICIAPTELTVRFSIEESSCVLFTFSIASNKADMWIMPGRIKAFLEKHGKFPFEADEFLDFFKQFIEVSRCKTPPYDYLPGFYYANISETIRCSSSVIGQVEKFVSSVSDK